MVVGAGTLPLSPYRALDLTNATGYYCGKILADLGADVLKVEPPGGDPGRNIGPFYHDEPGKEQSLFFFAYNTNKRSITLNIGTRDGQELFKRLVRTADFVIESFPPGRLEALGLGYEVLKAVNPRIIVVSITPFGQTGPRRDWKGSDIVAIATGGLSHIMGSPERTPTRVCVDQAHLIAGSSAAMGAMIAHYYREDTGIGQHVDVSTQESVVISAMSVPQAWDLERFIWPRSGAFLPRSGKRVRYIWRCKDGYVSWRLFGGGLGVKTRALVEWMASEGKAGELSDVEWEKVDYLTVSKDDFDRWQSIFAEFFLTHTKAELNREALARGFVLSPVNTPKELLEDPQLIARGFWQEVAHSELGAHITYPGPLYRSTEISWTIRRAPLIGEDNHRVYEGELGLSKQELAVLKHNGVI